MRLAKIFTCLLLFCCLSKSTHRSGILPQEAYIWQKLWVPSVQNAIQQSNFLLKGWRFLAGEREPDGRIIYPSIPFDDLQSTGKMLTAVYRFDRIQPLPNVQEIRELITRSPAYQKGIRHIELDLDWPTQKLAAYIYLLKQLRSCLPQETYLTITVLPDWLRSTKFPNLTQKVDDLILQVHAVDDPREGLFNDYKALHYIDRMNRISRKPFYIALPTYGLKVGMERNGRLNFVEGENNLWLGKTAGQELFTDPYQITKFLNHLETDIPMNLKGLVWFRLPIAEDRRNWSISTWLTVLQRRKPYTQIKIENRVDPQDTELFDLFAVNQGNVDARLPLKVELKCAIGDGFPPYQLSIGNNGHYFLESIKNPPFLPVGAKRRIGWMRCLSQ